MAREPKADDRILEALKSEAEAFAALAPGIRGASAKAARASLGQVLDILRDTRERLANGGAPDREVLEAVSANLERLAKLIPGLSKPAKKRLREDLGALVDEVSSLETLLDPITTPASLFDPASPRNAGRLVAFALLAQPRLPLGQVGNMYGSGVYALYYTGDCPIYRPISGTETPIYIGKADPKDPEAETATQQGPQLTGRLKDHRKMISVVEKYGNTPGNSAAYPIRLEDFQYRRLVVSTHAQFVAERYLITLFQPIWNKEMRVAWGISKHGDRAGRNDARTPWDVLHPGRDWALAPRLINSKEPAEILKQIAGHFARNPAYTDMERIIEQFRGDFIQDAVEVGASAEDVEGEDPASDEEDAQED